MQFLNFSWGPRTTHRLPCSFENPHPHPNRTECTTDKENLGVLHKWQLGGATQNGASILETRSQGQAVGTNQGQLTMTLCSGSLQIRGRAVIGKRYSVQTPGERSHVPPTSIGPNQGLQLQRHCCTVHIDSSFLIRGRATIGRFFVQTQGKRFYVPRRPRVPTGATTLQ